MLYCNFAPLSLRQNIAMLELIHRTVLGQAPEHFKQRFCLEHAMKRSTSRYNLNKFRLHEYINRRQLAGSETICAGSNQHLQHAANEDRGSKDREMFPGPTSGPGERLREQIASAVGFYFYHASQIACSHRSLFYRLEIVYYFFALYVCIS